MKRIFQGFVVLLFLPLLASAQFTEDAQRLGSPGLGVGARALGMGNAYIGVANDYSALYWNPAGLTQSQLGEFSFGLSYRGADDKSTFFTNQLSNSVNSTNLNSLGFVLPIPVNRGAFSVAFGFTRQATFTSGLSFNGYNPVSSIVQTWAPDGTRYPQDISLAEQLELAHADTNTGLFISPIKNNVTQLGTVTESGGLNNWMVGGAMDVAKNLSVGVTLTYVSGSYRYDRDYREQDTRLVHTSPFDFSEIRVQDFIEDDISGVNAKFGLMYREPNLFRIGFSIKTPTAFSVKETFGTTAATTFRTPDADGNFSYGPVDNPGSTEYDVHTPWVFGVGGSLIIRNLVLSGDAEYTDWTQTRFSKANQDVMAMNTEFATKYQGAYALRGGAEYEIPRSGVRVRGGFIYDKSMFRGDPSNFDQKYWTAGAGVMLGEATMLDFGFAHGWWDTYRVNYDLTSRVDEHIRTNTFLLALTHRF
jgi:hypothetical protein